MAARMAAPLSAQEEQDKWLHGALQHRQRTTGAWPGRVIFFSGDADSKRGVVVVVAVTRAGAAAGGNTSAPPLRAHRPYVH
jgi:hypothetical protein